MMRLSPKRCAAVAALAGIALSPQRATANLFGTTGLDPAFCQLKTVRKTVVYIDDSVMIEGRTEWATKISDKLRATLTSGEPVSVVRLSPSTGQSTELWSGCWPNYTDEQRADIAKQSYIFSKSPLDGLSDQQTFFMSGFGSALTKIYLDAKRPEGDVRINVAKPPQKQLLRAIATDDGRFSNTPLTTRAIVYSDMLENSDLGSVYKAVPDPFPDFADKLGSHLRRSVFYVFGVASDVSGGQSLQETAKGFWALSLRSMSGVVGGFGSDLNLSNDLPVKSYSFETELDFNGEKLNGKMSLLVDSDGMLVDSWIGFSRLSISGLTGSFKCVPTNCKLDANTTSAFITKNISSERILMSGKSTTISGQIGVPNSKEFFTVTASSESN
jgi:hypothetical protein